jgi:hypothetical protein
LTFFSSSEGAISEVGVEIPDIDRRDWTGTLMDRPTQAGHPGADRLLVTILAGPFRRGHQALARMVIDAVPITPAVGRLEALTPFAPPAV